MNTNPAHPGLTTLIQCTLVIFVMLISGHAIAQSLYLTGEDEYATGPNATDAPVILIEDVSLTYIPEPEIRTYKEHDIITIIIDEVSSQTSSQSLETKNISKNSVEINAMIDLLKLLELRVDTNPRFSSGTGALLDANANRKFTGEGDYERKDKFIARITATVLEVKPNGSLVLEAQKRIQKDEEIQTLIIAGLARTEDVTSQNTILSSQLANLSLAVENEGNVKNASGKGFVTKFLDMLFAF